MKSLWFIIGILSALAFGAFANLPESGGTNGSMATTSDVSEIRTKRQSELSFDQDFKRLSSLQGRYRENLPLRGNRSRISTSRSSRTPVLKKVQNAKPSGHRYAKPRARAG